MKHVTINASVPLGGRWLKENLQRVYGIRHKEFHDYKPPRLRGLREWYRDKDDPAEKEMRKLIPKLCKLSNKIKTLTIEDYHLDTESLTELLSSQTELQTIRIINIKCCQGGSGVFILKRGH